MTPRLYRLKVEALDFFDQHLSRKVQPLSFWKEKNVSINALDEVCDIWITYGIERDKDSSSISGWSSNSDDGENRSSFHFTLNAINIGHNNHEILSKGIEGDLSIELESVFRKYIQKTINHATKRQ